MLSQLSDFLFGKTNKIINELQSHLMLKSNY